ncbi:acyltransferase [Bradyrhizobium liaoningense]|uniref:acyltransferase family protein n=1 Tax=Bradyrhizobium liaoningense TaxID=43992 RepID=UPI001BA6EDB2|nr:acyltransferase [Bradyrhizobium liaoningense]MBR0904595.1 acyltransferase [Bradyrhizobium liaoningense]
MKLEGRNKIMDSERYNSFDAVRLFAALCVFFSHQMILAGYAEPALGPLGISLASTGLYTFFALSGYLVFKSVARDYRASAYFRARVLRIFPGAIANTLFCLALGSAITTLPFGVFWRSEQTISYFVHNALILIPPTQFVLPGVLADARWPVINGSVWTIKYELLCYAALFVVFHIFKHVHFLKRGWLMVTLCFIAYYICQNTWFPKPDENEFFSTFNSFNIARFSMTFFFGAFLAACEPYGEKIRLVILCIPASLVAFGPSVAIGRAGVILLLALLVIEIGRSRLLFSATYRRFGDLSYGIFLYAYPIQIFVLTRYFDGQNFMALTALSLAFIVGCAWMSWHLVERPALKYKIAANRRIASPR